MQIIMMYCTINLKIEIDFFFYCVLSSVHGKDLSLLRDKCVISVSQWEHKKKTYFIFIFHRFNKTVFCTSKRYYMQLPGALLGPNIKNVKNPF